VANLETQEIICTVHEKGKVHDLRVWKESQMKMMERIKCLADKGYQGIKKNHENSETPIKKKKGKKLSREEKKQNRRLAQERIIIEHINRKLKIFRILSSKYRNRRKRFALRFNLIAGIYNHEIYCRAKYVS
jgi:IS5 family transposase